MFNKSLAFYLQNQLGSLQSILQRYSVRLRVKILCFIQDEDFPAKMDTDEILPIKNITVMSPGAILSMCRQLTGAQGYNYTQIFPKTFNKTLWSPIFREGWAK